MVVSLAHANERRLPDTSPCETTAPLSSEPTTDESPPPSTPPTQPVLSSNAPATPSRRLSSSDLPHSPDLGHPEHHKSAGAVLSVSQQYSPSKPAPTPAAINSPQPSLQRSAYSHNRTRSDDDCDYASVVLRTKSCSTIAAPISTAKSKNPMDRSFSIPATPCEPGDDIDKIRAFLESEYVAPTDEFWHMQRDSFIHRSYNKKLLARKNAIDANEVPKRPASVPLSTRKSTTDGSSAAEKQPTETQTTPAVVKRDSFIRHSLNTLRRSFSIRSSASKKKRAQMEQQTPSAGNVRERRIGRKTPTLMETEHPNDARRLNANNNNKISEKGTVSDEGERWDHVDPTKLLNVPLENVRNQGHSRNSSTSSCTSNRSTNSGAVLNLRSAPASSVMAPLQSQSGSSDTNATSAASQPPQQQPNNLIRSPSHHNQHASTKIDTKSIKHLQTSSNTTTTSTPNPIAARAPSPHPAKNAKHEAPEKEKKEKKRKEMSSGRQKKFHRHFQQVAADEHLINYFSCALVSDILLQGHLYITDNYFAFYSNVFGFVTKLLIPTVSVVKISKEKTAKIIPNAVGVATADERHVFGSFISREAAYRLMLSVWLPVAPVAAPAEVAEVVAAQIKLNPVDVEASEFSIEDDSSSAISGNESPPVGVQESTTSTDASQTVRHRIVGNGVGADVLDSAIASSPGNDDAPSPYHTNDTVRPVPKTSRSTSPAPKIVSLHRFYQFQFPDNFVRIGIFLSVLLVLLSAFLIYRIMNVPRMTPYTLADFGPLNAKWNDADENMDVYAEVLKWQRQMQANGADEAQIILNSNLEKIARVRKSLETLSILIHDKNTFSLPGGAAESYVPDKDLPLDASSFERTTSET